MHPRAAPRVLLGQVTRFARCEDVDDVPAFGEGADVLTQQRLEATEIRRKVRTEDEDPDRAHATCALLAFGADASVAGASRVACSRWSRPASVSTAPRW